MTLGELLRRTLDGSERPYQTVSEEVGWLKRFAEILETRHHGRLRFEWRVDADVHDHLFPVMLLQPQVENAVHHGVLRRTEGGRVEVQIFGQGHELICEVVDDGPGFEPEGGLSGRGLELTRRRLSLKSPDVAMEVMSEVRGTRVRLALPRRSA